MLDCPPDGQWSPTAGVQMLASLRSRDTANRSLPRQEQTDFIFIENIENVTQTLLECGYWDPLKWIQFKLKSSTPVKVHFITDLPGS